MNAERIDVVDECPTCYIAEHGARSHCPIHGYGIPPEVTGRKSVASTSPRGLVADIVRAMRACRKRAAR